MFLIAGFTEQCWAMSPVSPVWIFVWSIVTVALNMWSIVEGVHRHTLHLAASHHCCAGALWVCCSFEDEVTSIVSPVPFSFQLILIYV